jgi:dTDP-4-dehydrorhamnose reductase
MSKLGTVLVTGASGAIGGHLAARLAAEGADVVASTRTGTGKTLTIDLTADPRSWKLPPKISLAYLCAAQTSLEQCRKNPQAARVANVDGNAALASMLAERGARVVFLSTNLVFDGSAPFSPAGATPNPQTEYGRQKAEMERRLQSGAFPSAIVRFTKVLARRTALFEKWAAQLRQGQKIFPFLDMVMAPISLDFAVEVLWQVGQSGSSGIVQASASSDVSYAQAAQIVAASIGASDDLVSPASWRESGLMEQVPNHTTLDCARLQQEFTMKTPEPGEAINFALG